MDTEFNNDFKEIFKTNEWLEFKNYCDEYTIWDILGMFRYEDANTNFLVNFLDAKKNIFNLGTKPILKFIELICYKDKNKTKIKGDFSNIGNIEKDDIKIDIRQSYNGTKLHPDLVIEIKNQYLILLEAKLEARESGENQCLEYYKNTPHDKYLGEAFIYLSLFDKDIISDEEHYIKITYQDLIDGLYEQLGTISNDLLTQYLKGFIYLVKNKYISDNFKMPITKKEKDLVMKVYNKNKNIIDNYIKDVKKNSDFDIDIELFFIILYKTLNEQELVDSIWRKYHNVGIVLIDNGANPKIEISRYGDIMKYLIKKLIDNGYEIEYINNLTNTKYKYLYEEKEFAYQNFTKNQTEYYGDIELKGKKYKILVSYYYSDVIDFLNTLKNHNVKLKDIVIKGKQNYNVLYSL